MKVRERCVIEIEMTEKEYDAFKSRARKAKKNCAAFAHDAVTFFLKTSVQTPEE